LYSCRRRTRLQSNLVFILTIVTSYEYKIITILLAVVVIVLDCFFSTRSKPPIRGRSCQWKTESYPRDFESAWTLLTNFPPAVVNNAFYGLILLLLFGYYNNIYTATTRATFSEYIPNIYASYAQIVCLLFSYRFICHWNLTLNKFLASNTHVGYTLCTEWYTYT